MAGQVRAAVYAAVCAVRRRQVRLEGLHGSARGRGAGAALACQPGSVSHPVTHECLLATNIHRRQLLAGALSALSMAVMEIVT